jgi:CRP-like cAMP-binding protein/Fe-S-cluster-containing hydrogenase component 2
MSHQDTAKTTMVKLKIDGKEVEVPRGTSVFDAARMSGTFIPVLCHQQNETPVGVCRVCVVEVGGKALAASCIRLAEDGLEVKTNTPKLEQTRKTIVELLMADHASPCVREKHTSDCELEALARRYGVQQSRFDPRTVQRPLDDSSPSILVDLGACILCDRCVRACSEIRDNEVIARRGKGYNAMIAFDNDQLMGSSSCVSCGECMVSCPTGALTNKLVVGQHYEVMGDAVSVRELLDLPVFKGVSGTFLELNKGSIVKRHFKKGDILFREGDYGSTAYFILEGTVDIFISSPRGHVDTAASGRTLFNKLTSMLVGRKEKPREEENLKKEFISIDAPVDLDYGNPVAQLVPGDLFGEMSCMSFYPRSATVRAATDCVVLEMLRNVLDVLQKNKSFRAQLDRKYRERALETHLRSVPMLSSLTPEFIDRLRDRVELIRYAPGSVIFDQGATADAFYLVRIGFVKVTQKYPGGEVVLAYLSKGNYFGEIGLLGAGQRTATCSALDHVEVVKLPAEDFAVMMEQFPDIKTKLQAVADERISENQARFKQISTVRVDQFLEQGLLDAQSLLVLDLTRCTRCDLCVKACADSHDGVTRLIRDGVRFDNYLIATSCRQCRDPLCMVGCPVGAIRRRNSLEVIIEDWCIGCGVCANNCPYGNINLHEFEVPLAASEFDLDDTGQLVVKKAQVVRKATSCNLCHDHPEPSCVYACPHDAAHRVNPADFFSKVSQEKRGASGAD